MIRVLTAEDDPVQNELLRDALAAEPDFLCCGQAHDGEEALELLYRERPDVLLLDIVMPRMDGVDLLHELRENPPDKRPYIIALSAYDQERITREVLRQGADWVLLKPYRYELLFRRIRSGRLLGGREPMERAVSHILMEMGARTNTLGYTYLEQALMIVLTHPGACSMNKDIYAEIAARNDTTEPCVEKAMSRLIRQLFDTDSEALRRLLQLSAQENVTRLSNGRFLTLLAEEFRRREAMVRCGERAWPRE